MEYKYKDKATNQVRPGDAVWFDPVGGVAEIVAISPPHRGPDGSDVPGILSLQIDIPFAKDKDKPDTDGFVFGFMLFTKNPRREAEVGAKVEQQVADILSGKTKPAATLVMKKGK